MAVEMVTIPRAEYERLKRVAAKRPFLAELDEALASGLDEPWTEVQPRRRRT